MAARFHWMQFHCFLKALDCKVVLAGQAESHTGGNRGANAKGSEFLGPLHFGHPGVELAPPYKFETIPKVGCFIIGIEFQGSPEFLLCSRPVPIVDKLYPS